MRIKTGIGQDSHRFDGADTDKILVLGGVEIADQPPLQGNSDADVVLHAITNAISGISGSNILGSVSDAMCRQGVTDSRAYVAKAVETLRTMRICHVSISIECKRPKITPYMEVMKQSIAALLGIDIVDVGITATSGEGMTAFGRGEGIQAFVIVTAIGD